MTEETDWKCGKHGFYTPDFERVIGGTLCPRILCLKCDEESLDADPKERPKNIPYFYKDELKVVLEEAHRLSAVWAFKPPVVYPHFTFAADLSPIVPEDALTAEEIMERMTEALPQMNETLEEREINPESFSMLPGKEFNKEIEEFIANSEAPADEAAEE